MFQKSTQPRIIYLKVAEEVVTVAAALVETVAVAAVALEEEAVAAAAEVMVAVAAAGVAEVSSKHIF